MANMHLVTGFAGREHVTSIDQGLLNSYIFGNIEAVMERGNQFEASIISNNIIRVKDGDLLMQGRFARLNDDSYVDLTIDNGTQGYYRNDLIVARYLKDAITAVETVDLVVIKGENAASSPADPAYVTGDIKSGTDFQNDIPLWRVSLNGLNVEGLTCLFSTFSASLSSILTGLHGHTSNKSNPHGVTAAQIGAATASALQSHLNNKSNPHNVTAEQLGAVSSDSYMWEKCTPQSYSYTVASSTSSVTSDSGGFIYATSITYDGSNLTLVNPTTVSVFSDGDGCIPSGMFFAAGTSATVSVCYKAATDTGTDEWGEYGSASGYKVTGTIIAPVYIETVLSSNINAYPQNATQGGYYYGFIGKLFERMGRVQTGSYTGTGTCGANNPNSLTFSSAPKLVIVRSDVVGIFLPDALNSSGYVYKGYNISSSSSNSACAAMMVDNTLSWYYSTTSNANLQFNTADTIYHWVAIG